MGMTHHGDKGGANGFDGVIGPSDFSRFIHRPRRRCRPLLPPLSSFPTGTVHPCGKHSVGMTHYRDKGGTNGFDGASGPSVFLRLYKPHLPPKYIATATDVVISDGNGSSLWEALGGDELQRCREGFCQR